MDKKVLGLLFNELSVGVCLRSAGQLFRAIRCMHAEYNLTRFRVSSGDMKEIQLLPWDLERSAGFVNWEHVWYTLWSQGIYSFLHSRILNSLLKADSQWMFERTKKSGDVVWFLLSLLKHWPLNLAVACGNSHTIWSWFFFSTYNLLNTNAAEADGNEFSHEGHKLKTNSNWCWCCMKTQRIAKMNTIHHLGTMKGCKSCHFIAIHTIHIYIYLIFQFRPKCWTNLSTDIAILRAT